MLINPKSLLPVLVMISNISVPISNRFHTIRASNGKITFLGGYPYLTPSFERNPCTITTDLEAPQGKDFVILACTVLAQYSSVTNRQTDRRPGHS